MESNDHCSPRSTPNSLKLTNNFNKRVLSIIYHELIINELRKISKTDDLPCLSTIHKTSLELCRIIDTKYCLSERELESIISNVLNKLKIENINVNMIINLLKDYGFIVKLKDNCYRTFHADILVRLPEVRISPILNKMTLANKYAIKINNP